MQIVIVKPVPLALSAIDAEHVSEQISHDSVRLLHLNLFVALRAGNISIGFIVLRDALLDRDKGHKAVVASARRTFWAL
jgi:hypothetical protein